MRVLDWIMATVIVVGFSMAGMGDEAYGAETGGLNEPSVGAAVHP